MLSFLFSTRSVYFSGSVCVRFVQLVRLYFSGGSTGGCRGAHPPPPQRSTRGVHGGCKSRPKAKILLQKSRFFCKVGYFSSNFAKIYIKI